MSANNFYRPRARKLPEDKQARADIEHVLRHGYIALEGIFSKAEAEEAKAEIGKLSGETPKSGRNPFEGLDTNRIYSLLNKTRVFDKFTMLPRVLALNDYFLEPGYMISALHSIQINPGENPQALHHDDAFCHGVSRPRPPLSAAIILAFDDFTEANGATRIVPGSHEWGTELPTQEQAKPATCPAGTALYFIGTTWHGGGGNTTDKPRVSATVQYCQPWCRPIENQILAVDPRRLDQIPERVIEMMGYRTHPPFIGYADGLNPQRAARRMVRWLQQPLDPAPPAFPAHNESKL